MPGGECLATEEAAREFGVSTRRVQAMIKAKRLPAIKPGRDWLIRRQDLELVRDRKTGKPRKAKRYGA